jgi:hypothetical protein
MDLYVQEQEDVKNGMDNINSFYDPKGINWLHCATNGNELEQEPKTTQKSKLHCFRI